MDYEEYRSKYIIDPPPPPRFDFDGVQGLALFYEDYEQANPVESKKRRD